MATLDGVPVDCVLHVLRDGESGREGAFINVDRDGAERFGKVMEDDGTVVYEGFVSIGGEQYLARVPVGIFNWSMIPGGARIQIMAGGPPERL